jgi:hypothetical protein
MKITDYKSLNNVSDLQSLIRYSNINFNLILSVVNGAIDLVDNCNTGILLVTFPKANTTYGFKHSLGRIPTGYIPVGLNTTSTLFDGNQANTITQIFLQASAISNGKVLVF